MNIELRRQITFSMNSTVASRSAALHMVLWVLTGWLDRREREAVAYLMDLRSRAVN